MLKLRPHHHLLCSARQHVYYGPQPRLNTLQDFELWLQQHAAVHPTRAHTIRLQVERCVSIADVPTWRGLLSADTLRNR